MNRSFGKLCHLKVVCLLGNIAVMSFNRKRTINGDKSIASRNTKPADKHANVYLQRQSQVAFSRQQ